MGDLVLTTFDWVPEPPRGFVRDLRVRWALEEAGLAYRVATTPFEGREAVHFAQQPFGQVPWLTDGDITVFESGAILLYLGEKSAALMPTDPRGRAGGGRVGVRSAQLGRNGEPALVDVPLHGLSRQCARGGVRGWLPEGAARADRSGAG